MLFGDLPRRESKVGQVRKRVLKQMVRANTGLRSEDCLGLGEYGSFRQWGVLYFGVLIVRILLFRVLYQGPLFSDCHLDVDVCTDVGMDGCK